LLAPVLATRDENRSRAPSETVVQVKLLSFDIMDEMRNTAFIPVTRVSELEAMHSLRGESTSPANLFRSLPKFISSSL